MRLFHPKVLLTSLNICYDIQKSWDRGQKWFIILFWAKQKKINCCTENIQHCCCKKKLSCNIIKKLKFNGAKSFIHLSYLPVSFRTFLQKFIFMNRIKIPRAESCDHCLHKNLTIQWVTVLKTKRKNIKSFLKFQENKN